MRQFTVIFLLAAATMAGCEVQVDPSPGSPSDGGQAATSGAGQTVQSGGGSALGKAKQSAQRIEDQVDLHNRRIEEAADAVNNP